MPNQWMPTSPLEEITPHILRLWKARQTDKMIVENLRKVIDTSHYGIGITKFKEIHNAMGLQCTRQQNHSIETICDAMVDLREAFPNAGAQEMVSLLFHEKDMSVSRNMVISYFAAYEAGHVHQQKAHRLQRRCFWAAGVNDLFAVDQHEKWLRFGLTLHTGIEPFSSHVPMITQSDPGSENYGIANTHTMLHQMYDSSLQGTLQHRWMRTKKNVMPKVSWSQLHRRFTPGYETLLDEGVESSWYDSDNVLQVMTASIILQIDAKILPHGMPNLIYDSPEDFGAMDFKASFILPSTNHVQRTYVKPNHPVFDLVPQPLDQFIQHCYDDLGRPPVTGQTAWHIYLNLLHSIRLAEQLPPMVDGDVDEGHLPLLEHQRELLCADDAYYMGGVHGGLGLDASDHRQLDSLVEQDEPDPSLLPAEQVVEEEGLVAWFSDKEEEDETYEW
ncbi:hypothetical protein DFJ58DRAFT_720957 [Suillus subalutaceus]|uniref:uncharacterized protein n=1 Tax=Suillus subalutaceus TaxID=48586 RepID=UPI001B8644B5|nr:uncharacterized protein DFJ58DRAFT_720957 [Suillus subalutaceus]KAG1876492.1 hypothetical protein DFJ58DRAFT_720957 [Suillus subalutaceus]